MAYLIIGLLLIILASILHILELVSRIRALRDGLQEAKGIVAEYALRFACLRDEFDQYTEGDNKYLHLLKSAQLNEKRNELVIQDTWLYSLPGGDDTWREISQHCREKGRIFG